LGGELFDGAAGDELDDGEGEGEDADEGGDDQQQAFEEVSGHVCSVRREAV
jgi:hypothetical protein